MQGESFTINVINELHDTTMDVVTSVVSISHHRSGNFVNVHMQHWHGLHMYGYNAYDGGAFVNQCPIIPKKTFQYQFSVPDQAVRHALLCLECVNSCHVCQGTYWYHSHYSAQYCDGLRGALVIYDPGDPLKHLYDVDDGMP